MDLRKFGGGGFPPLRFSGDKGPSPGRLFDWRRGEAGPVRRLAMAAVISVSLSSEDDPK